MTDVRRETIEVSGFDGSMLTATLLAPPGVAARAVDNVPLLLLPGHMSPASTLEPLAIELIERDARPALLIDYRGRGGSEPRTHAGLYSPRAEAADLVSMLDAMNWHHADVIGSARGGLVAMCLTAMRPALIRRLVLNDIGPELDGVGLARLRMAAVRRTEPDTWGAARALLRARGGSRYPVLGDADYDGLAQATWANENGAPRSRVHTSVFEHFAGIDPDARYPTLWPEFRALRSRPLLLIRAEHSDVLNDAVVERMKTEHQLMRIEMVEGQGHAPLLHLGTAPNVIGAFLSS